MMLRVAYILTRRLEISPSTEHVTKLKMKRPGKYYGKTQCKGHLRPTLGMYHVYDLMLTAFFYTIVQGRRKTRTLSSQNQYWVCMESFRTSGPLVKLKLYAWSWSVLFAHCVHSLVAMTLKKR